jgi:mevalonate kinase
VLWPAVFRNGTDGKACEEIDQKMFENADGVQGINQLVGVGVQENREGWEFWTRELSTR